MELIWGYQAELRRIEHSIEATLPRERNSPSVGRHRCQRNRTSLRVVTYNIDADTGGTVGVGGSQAGPGLTTYYRQLAGRPSPVMPNQSMYSPLKS